MAVAELIVKGVLKVLLRRLVALGESLGVPWWVCLIAIVAGVAAIVAGAWLLRVRRRRARADEEYQSRLRSGGRDALP